MGLDAYQGILQKSKVSSDHVNEQVTRVGQRIAATDRKDYQWEFKVIEDPQANAFCLPGGKVAVYTGLLPITRDDAGLAAVLGHEVSHAIARHGGERMSQGCSCRAAWPRRRRRWRATIHSSCSRSPRCSAPAPRSADPAVQPQPESEADHLGLIYMAKAGYHPVAARDLWIRMGEASKGGSAPPAFLSTHPSAATRVTQIEGWMPEALEYYQPREGPPQPPTPNRGWDDLDADPRGRRDQLT